MKTTHRTLGPRECLGLLAGALLIAPLLGLVRYGSGPEDTIAPLATDGSAAEVGTSASSASLPAAISDAQRDCAVRAFGQLPLYFIENQGQVDERVAYYIKGTDKTLYFTTEGVTFSLENKDQRWTVKLEFVGANAAVVPRGEEKQQAIFSYFKGKPEEWMTGCPTYAKVVYEDLWPGTDLVYHGTVNRLKYEFIVAPGADPGQIRLAYRGATSVAVSDTGTLEVRTPIASFEDASPIAFQEIDGQRAAVNMTYALHEHVDDASWVYGFDIGAYDKTLPLLLDPEMLVYCGYIGGRDYDEGYDVALDGSGAAFVTGKTYSSESEGFPVLVGPDLTYSGLDDAFVAKVHPSGVALEYCGYIGGTGEDCAVGIAVDDSGAAYVAGWTSSSESQGFPVLVGPDLTWNGLGDAFVAKVDPTGTTLEYCGYIGGSLSDQARDIVADASGAVYVTGEANSSESEGFPVLVGPDLTFNGRVDVFVAKVDPSGAALEYCGYIGGRDIDEGLGIDVDPSGAVHLAGKTCSHEWEDFPVLVGPDLTFNGADFDGFVAKVRSTGESLEYCGYIGGYWIEECCGIAVDDSGAAHVSGWTDSPEWSGFPVIVGPDLTFNGELGDEDAFVAKVEPSGVSLVYCGYIGGTADDAASGIALDDSGAAYVAGGTHSLESGGFPVLIGPDLTFNGETDAFIAKVAASGATLLYCGYIGGKRGEGCWSVAVDGCGAAYVTGMTHSAQSAGFPVRVGPDLTYNYSWDAFVAKIPPLDQFPASWANYGTGWPGTNGIPSFTASATPVLGSSITLDIGNSLGAPTSAFLFMGLAPAGISTPFGGTLLVLPKWVYSIALLAGTTSLPGQVPYDPALAGLHLYVQVLEMDPGASYGISFTRGLELVLGYF
ncbi:MAG: hypothetical protein AB1486_00700 [Planctomycetota bacterium]